MIINLSETGFTDFYHKAHKELTINLELIRQLSPLAQAGPDPHAGARARLRAQVASSFS